MKKLILIFLLSLFVTFCQRKNSISDLEINTIISNDTITQFEKLAIKNDTLEYVNFDPFIFLKSGHLFGENKKQYIKLSVKSEKVMHLELYILKNDTWIINDRLDLNNDFILPSFNYKIKDYNFDSCNDLYIQRFSTNGLGMSYGYLITLNKNLKMNHQQETDDLSNMTIDYEHEQLISDSIISNINGRFILKNYYYWKNNKLKKVN